MIIAKDQWDLGHLRQHLQFAVDLEMWTIPFYMSAMFSIIDRSSEAFQLIQSVVNQEMLHVQLVSNVCNAYGHRPTFPAPVYEGEKIPHLDFALDTPDPRTTYHPSSAEIGPLDELRINSMCLIEYPEYDTGHEPDLRDTVSEYGSIGEFYDAVEFGARQLAADIQGGVNQIDMFSAFYRNMPKLTVEASGKSAYAQVALLIDAIRDQGEGRKKNELIEKAFQNTADDSCPELSHFDKFEKIRDEKTFPPTYPLKETSEYTQDDKELRKILVVNFTALRASLDKLFAGQDAENFEALMVTIGGNITNCWKNGVLPKFSRCEIQ